MILLLLIVLLLLNMMLLGVLLLQLHIQGCIVADVVVGVVKGYSCVLIRLDVQGTIMLILKRLRHPMHPVSMKCKARTTMKISAYP